MVLSHIYIYRSQPATYNKKKKHKQTNKPHLQEAMSHWYRQLIAI